MPGKHVCQFGDRFCGRFGYDDLCDYCKRKYDLELAQQENQRAGELAVRRRQAKYEAAEAVGSLAVEHPVATGAFLLGLAGIAIGMSDRDVTPSKKKRR